MKLQLTCKETVRLMLEGEDHELKLSDRTLIRMHLTICRNCSRFSRQVQLMRGALDQWRQHAEEGSTQATPPTDPSGNGS